MSTALPPVGKLASRAAGARAEAAALKEAKAAYRRLGFEAQMRIVDEIIETRAAELMAAYPSIISLGIGRRRWRDRQGHARTSKVGALHLRVLVRRKWKPAASNAQRKGCIPRYLLAKAGPDDARFLVAVPTDIDAMPLRSSMQLQAMAIRGHAPAGYSKGSLSCVVQEQHSGGARYLGLSCRHVLSPLFNGVPSSGTTAHTVDEMTTATVLGDGTPLRGSFGDPARLDFDAQFFSFQSPEKAALAIRASLSFAGVIASQGQFLLPMFIAAGYTRKSIPVRFHTFWKTPRPLFPGWQAHRELIELTFSGKFVTDQGDSGSPLLIPQDGQRPIYVGMHIARHTSDAGAVSYCVPAWDLLNPALYGPQASRSTFTLV
jgi:hypothetical protein